MAKPNPKFDIEKQFEFYLDLVKLDKRKMPPYQIKELRRAFYGAWGIQLLLQRDDITVYADKHGETAAVDILQNMLEQCSDFWNKEIVPGTINPN